MPSLTRYGCTSPKSPLGVPHPPSSDNAANAKMRRRQMNARVSGGGSFRMMARGRLSSARDAAAAAAPRCIAGIRFEAVGAVRVTLDADHRKNDDGRGFRIGVDIFAAARTARFVGKSDNFAHCNPLAAAA